MTDPLTGRLTVLPCLGFLKGSNCTHYDGESARRPAYRSLIERGEMATGLAADDGVALHFIGHELAHVVSSRPGAAAYKVRRVTSGLEETKIAARYLGASSGGSQ